MDEVEKYALLDDLRRELKANRTERDAADEEDLPFYHGVQHGMMIAKRLVEAMLLESTSRGWVYTPSCPCDRCEDYRRDNGLTCLFGPLGPRPAYPRPHGGA